MLAPPLKLLGGLAPPLPTPMFCSGIVRFLVWALGDRPGKAVWKLCGGRTKIVRCRLQLPCSLRRSALKLYGTRVGSIQRPRGDSAMTVRGPYDHRAFFFFFCSNDHLKSCDFRKISARPPHDIPTTCLRAAGLRSFQICRKSSLNKIVEATAPMNPYENGTAAACLRAETAG